MYPPAFSVLPASPRFATSHDATSLEYLWFLACLAHVAFLLLWALLGVICSLGLPGVPGLTRFHALRDQKCTYWFEIQTIKPSDPKVRNQCQPQISHHVFPKTYATTELCEKKDGKRANVCVCFSSALFEWKITGAKRRLATGRTTIASFDKTLHKLLSL